MKKSTPICIHKKDCSNVQNAVIVFINEDASLIKWIEKLPYFFDAVVITTDTLVGNSDDYLSYKIKLVLQVGSDYSKKDIWDYVRSRINIKWVFFMNSNEYFDLRFCNISHILSSHREKTINVYRIYSEDGISFSEIENNKPYIAHYGYICNTTLCSEDEVCGNLRIADSTYKCLVVSIVVPAHIDAATKKYSIDSVFLSDNEFSSFDKIDDNNLFALISERVDLISDFLLDYNATGNISLYMGDSGIALFFAQMYLNKGDDQYREKLYSLLDSISSNIEDYPQNIESSFCSGYAGFGWLICYLQKQELIDIDCDYFEVMDSILLKHMEYFISESKFDQLHEGISIGRYFLARNNKQALSSLIKALYASCDKSQSEIKLRVSDKNGFDTGLAHGNAGILYFLTKCLQVGVLPDICTEMINGIVTFYQNNELSWDIHKCYFPDVIHDNPQQDTQGTRKAWCYGDIGILFSLYLSGRTIGDENLMEYCTQRLKFISTKKSIYEFGVIDSIFCHGASAIAYIYKKMYNYTNIKEFHTAYIYWYKVTLCLGKSNTNKSGYIFLIDYMDFKWGITTGLLEGVSGVGLVLLSELYNTIDWDESMMLS